MNIHFFSSLFSQKLIQAFSWTLIHSLWQGLVLAVLTGMTLLLTKKSRPAFRYNLLAGLLASFVLTSVATFYLQYQKLANSAVLLTLKTDIGSGLVTKIRPDSHPDLMSSQRFLIKEVMNFCSENATVIVATWFLIFILKSIKAATALYYVHHLRHNGIREVGEFWRRELSELGRKLNIRTTIKLFESELVQTPMVMGFLKPIILVPFGFLTNLPFTQVEAILLHELAHVKRKDYMVNLFQNFAENVFFFNPAVLWISYLIREEREHCCDDLAIDITKNKQTFVNALVVFQEYKIAGSVHVLGFAGKKNHLLDRVKRIIYNNNKQLDAMEKLFVTASLITVAALSVAFSPTPIKKVFKENPVTEKLMAFDPLKKLEHAQFPVDTLPSKSRESTSNFEYHEMTKNNKHYQITKQNDTINELKIDGDIIPKDKYEAHELEIQQIMEEVEEQHEQAEIDRGKADILRQEADVHRKEADELRQGANDLRKSTDELRAQADDIRKHADEMRSGAEEIKKNADEFRANISTNHNRDELFWANAISAYEKNSYGIKKQAELARLDLVKSRLSTDEMRGHADVMRKQAEEMRAKADVWKNDADKMRAEYDKIQSDFIHDLVKEGVIKDQNNLSYKLSNDELIVNGVKQSQQLHAKLKARYIKNKSVEMVYNWKGRTGHTTTGYIITK